MQSVSDLLGGQGDLPPHVRSAVLNVPRHHFIPEIHINDAYKDVALPIGHGVTASRPSTIIDSISALGNPKKVLEIGTGSGWQTALISQFAKVYSVEINPSLHERASRDLRGYNVNLLLGDGLDGWPEHAPYDGIIVCASLEKNPQTLLDQLSEEGIIVVQIGEYLQSFRKDGSAIKSIRRGRFSPALTNGEKSL